MDLPMRVRPTNRSSATISTMAVVMMNSLRVVTGAPRIVNATLFPSGFGKGTCLVLTHRSTAFCRKMDTPTAEMSGASRGA